MNKLYMGIDSGHFSTKCIIIDEYNNIVINRSKNNQDSPLETTKTLLKEILKEIDLKKYTIASVGTTGYGRNLIGLLLNASVIKNEIESEIEGVLKFYPDAKKIISVGEKNSKVINIIKEQINNIKKIIKPKLLIIKAKIKSVGASGIIIGTFPILILKIGDEKIAIRASDNW